MSDWYTDRPTVCELDDCENEIAPGDDDSRFSPIEEKWVCWPCWESSEQSASTAYLVQPGTEVEKWYVHDLDVMGEYGDSASDLPHGPTLTRTYHRTDGWRGYYETTPGPGWEEISSGWTTGDWGDAISKSKQNFNCWVEDVLKGKEEVGVPVWIIFDQTSNVFSTAAGVFVPVATDPDELLSPPPPF